VKRAMRVILWGAGAAFLAGCAMLATLVFPGAPTHARSLKFEGFITLPAGFAPLTVMDYLTIDHGSLFATNSTNGDVYKIGLSKLLPTASDVSTFRLQPAAHGVVLDPVSGLAFATHSGANTVDVFDPATMRLVKRIAVADDPDGIFYSPFDRLVIVADGDARLVTLIDPRARAVVSTIALGGKPEFAVVDNRAKLLYVNIEDKRAVALVDLSKRSVVGRWPIPRCLAPTGLAMDEAGARLFVACSGNARLVVFDMVRRRVVADMSVGGGPDSVAFDAGLHRIYVTGRSGDMSVIGQDSPDAYHVLDLVHLHYGAHTLAVDPATHRVFAAYASLFVRPRIAVFSELAQ
jgi:DNA-binding beta-propeller fold protein YncE